MTIATVQFMSQALWRQVTYTTILPDRHIVGPGPYPVLYQLHGGNENHTAWLHSQLLHVIHVKFRPIVYQVFSAKVDQQFSAKVYQGFSPRLYHPGISELLNGPGESRGMSLVHRQSLR